MLRNRATHYILRFSVVFELYCLQKRFFNISKRHLQNLQQQSKQKSGTCIRFGNDETQAQKYLISTQKPNDFDHKHYKGRRILKFEFVFTINNGNCDASQSRSFCLPTWKDNLLGMNQTKCLIRPIIMIITIIRIKIKTRK